RGPAWGPRGWLASRGPRALPAPWGAGLRGSACLGPTRCGRLGSVPVVPPAKRQEVTVDGRALSLSNLDKVFYPEVGFTKGQTIDYYTRVAPALLGHLRGRPLTLKRYPNGVTGAHFYEKQCPSHAPEWVRTAPLYAGSKKIDFVLADDLATLVWLANLADL